MDGSAGPVGKEVIELCSSSEANLLQNDIRGRLQSLATSLSCFVGKCFCVSFTNRPLLVSPCSKACFFALYDAKYIELVKFCVIIRAKLWLFIHFVCNSISIMYQGEPFPPSLIYDIWVYQQQLSSEQGKYN